MMKNAKERKTEEFRMTECRYFNVDTDVCEMGLPVVPIFINFICAQNPAKCPVFYDVHGIGPAVEEDGAFGRN
jgi:hypothetical protein